MGGQHHEPLGAGTVKPDLKLMARSGVPVGKLLAAQLEFRESSPWTWLEYATAIGMLIALSVAACWTTSQALAFFGR